MARRGPNSQLKRVTFDDNNRKSLLEGMEYCSILRNLSGRDRHTREFINTRFALRMGRLWLTERQYGTAKYCLDKMVEEKYRYENAKILKRKK